MSMSSDPQPRYSFGPVSLYEMGDLVRFADIDTFEGTLIYPAMTYDAVPRPAVPEPQSVIDDATTKQDPS